MLPDIACVAADPVHDFYGLCRTPESNHGLPGGVALTVERKRSTLAGFWCHLDRVSDSSCVCSSGDRRWNAVRVHFAACHSSCCGSTVEARCSLWRVSDFRVGDLGRRRHADAKFSSVHTVCRVARPFGAARVWGQQGGKSRLKRSTARLQCRLHGRGQQECAVVRCGALWCSGRGLRWRRRPGQESMGRKKSKKMPSQPGCSCSSARCGSKEHRLGLAGIPPT
jgi:hypothetical protein